ENDLTKIITQIQAENPALILMDYRLGKGTNNVVYDAPTIASTVRTKLKIEIPIILISNETKISDFYKDFLNHDLFDYAIDKKSFSENVSLYGNRLISYSNAYKVIQESAFKLDKILGIPGDVD